MAAVGLNQTDLGMASTDGSGNESKGTTNEVKVASTDGAGNESRETTNEEEEFVHKSDRLTLDSNRVIRAELSNPHSDYALRITYYALRITRISLSSSYSEPTRSMMR